MAVPYLSIKGMHMPIPEDEAPVESPLFDDMARRILTVSYDKGFKAGHVAGYNEGLSAARAALNRLPKAQLDSDQEIGEDQAAMLERPIEDLDLILRTYNVLKREGINTIADLVNTTEAQLADARNFGEKCMDDVKTKLAKLDLSLK